MKSPNIQKLLYIEDKLRFKLFQDKKLRFVEKIVKKVEKF